MTCELREKHMVNEKWKTLKSVFDKFISFSLSDKNGHSLMHPEELREMLF